MKTTIDIADPLFADAKRAAERRGTTLKALVEQGLRQVLAEQAAERAAVPASQGKLQGSRPAPRAAGRRLGPPA
jgi:Arc/MetJ family transcription regulator